MSPGRSDRPVRVLFLCTHNSARSQIAEATLRHMGGERVEAHSAGTTPSRVHPDALALLAREGIDASALESKSLDRYLGERFDYVITVCDRAQESCPVFPGAPQQLHWSFPDPTAESDTAARRMAFASVYAELEKRIGLLLATLE